MSATATATAAAGAGGGSAVVCLAVVVMLVATAATPAEGFISKKTWWAIRRADRDGPFVGLVVPNAYEMDPVLRSPSFKPSNNTPILDVQAPPHHPHQVRSGPSSAARTPAAWPRTYEEGD